MRNERPAPGDKYIDSRDVIKAIEELESDLRDECAEELRLGIDQDDDPTDEQFEKWLAEAAESGHEEAQELIVLRELAEEGEGFPDWRYGATLIRESDFIEYAQQFAEEIGALPRDANWPACHIDWEAAAASLRQDYSEVQFGDETYLVRA